MAMKHMVAAKVKYGQKQLVRSAAAANGESESAFVRRLVLAEAARVLSQSAAEYSAARELVRPEG